MMMYEVSFVLPCLTGAASYAASVCTLRIRGIWILDISEKQLPSRVPELKTFPVNVTVIRQPIILARTAGFLNLR